MTDLEATLADRLVNDVSSLLAPGESVALLNFPQHGNAGDPAIWLGARRVLAALGHEVVYACNPFSYDERAMRRACPEGTVLLTGGGNLGDLYRPQQQLREHVLTTLRDRTIVQLPQSIFFRDPLARERMGRLISAHPRFVLMVREALSMERAQAFDCPTVLSPDLALGLGHQRADPPLVPILWLHRQPSSPEVLADQLPPQGASDVEGVEWLGSLTADQAGWPEPLRRQLERATAYAGDTAEAAQRRVEDWPSLARTFTPLAQAWVQRGLQLLSRGQVVVTDRLHGHLLALLLGRPHVVMDNAYGKCTSTLDTWTGTHPLVHRAASADEALAVARGLL